MRIVVDENIPRRTVAALRNMGHDVLDVRGTTDQGSADDWLWEVARREQALFVTTDKAFGYRRDERHDGILIVRLRKPNMHKIHDRIVSALTRFSERDWPGLVVIMRDRIQTVFRRRGRAQ